MTKRTFECVPAIVVIASFLAAGCLSFERWRDPVPPPIPLEQLEIDEEVTELYAMMRHDWAIVNERLESIPRPIVFPDPHPAHEARPVEPPSPPLRLTADSILSSIYVPVVGVRPSQLKNSFGAPRDGGRRKHRGIDIMAPRGTKVVAVADGEISYVGTQNKAGRSVWLVTDAGVSFFYAHLDRWANGLREGQPVRKGDTIGYVGNSGNARGSSTHLHFAVHRNSIAINPFPYLVTASISERAQPVLAGGLSGGSQ